MNDELNKLPDALFESLAEEQPDARRLATGRGVVALALLVLTPVPFLESLRAFRTP